MSVDDFHAVFMCRPLSSVQVILFVDATNNLLVPTKEVVPIYSGETTLHSAWLTGLL